MRTRDRLWWAAIALTVLANTMLLSSAYFAQQPFSRWELRADLSS